MAQHAGMIAFESKENWHVRRHIVFFALLALWVSNTRAAIPTSYPTGPGPARAEMSGGQLVYTYEPNGDRIPDFSHAGYKGGGVPIPDVPVVLTISPISGDDTANIQNAINQVASMPMQANGFRGALLLNPGVYEISSTMEINASGVVVRGSSDTPDGDTVLRRVAGGSDDLIFVRELPKTLPQEISGTRRNITNSYVPVGATWMTLENTSGYSMGDEIIIQRVSTPEWVEAMNETGQWDSNDAGIRWYRVVTEIDGNRIRIDAPVFQALEAEWGQHYVFKYSWPTRLYNVGIEDIWGESTVTPDDLDNTTGDLFMFYHVWNGWIRRCTNDRMTGHTIKVDACQFITVEDIVSYHNPLPGGHSGASVQIFTGDYMDSIYFHRITASSGGFEFTAGKQASGPVVFSESKVPKGFAGSGPHMQMNMGMLFDDLEMDHGISLQKQGKGWGGGNCMAWNVYTRQAFNFERPPTMHQWIHGGFADGGINSSQEGDNPETYMYGTFIEPTSLYRQQLYDRVGQTQAIAVIGQPGGGFGGGPPPVSTGIDYQAEDYTAQSGCTFSSGIGGYTGTGFMDYSGNGSWIEWNNVSANAAGDHDLVFRYGNGSGGDRQCALIVNGNNVGNVAFSPIGSWSTWGETSIYTVQLNIGNNTIRVQANTTDGGPNLDRMNVSLLCEDPLDYNTDCLINLQDFAIFTTHYLNHNCIPVENCE